MPLSVRDRAGLVDRPCIQKQAHYVMWLICFINIRRMFQFPPVNRISDFKQCIVGREISFQNRISSFCLESSLPLLESWKIGKFGLQFKTGLLFDEGVTCSKTHQVSFFRLDCNFCGFSREYCCPIFG